MATRVMLAGTVEFLDVTVTAAITLGTQPVAISIDHGATWLSAAWTSSAGTTCTASVLLGSGNPLPVAPITVPVLIQITSSPEIPILNAGPLAIVPA